jgi:hypothetical protein
MTLRFLSKGYKESILFYFLKFGDPLNIDASMTHFYLYIKSKFFKNRIFKRDNPKIFNMSAA